MKYLNFLTKRLTINIHNFPVALILGIAYLSLSVLILIAGSTYIFEPESLGIPMIERALTVISAIITIGALLNNDRS